MKYKLEYSHIQLKYLTSVVVKRLDVGVSSKVSGESHIVGKDCLLDSISRLIIEVYITELRVDAINHQTNLAKVVVFDYEGDRLPNVTTATMNLLFKWIFTCTCIITFQKLFYCERIVCFFVEKHNQIFTLPFWLLFYHQFNKSHHVCKSGFISKGRG